MTDIYVPQRVGEDYFIDWQAPVAGNDLVAWAWDNAAGKYVPQVAPKITSFVNAAHTHQAAAGGGQLDETGKEVGGGEMNDPKSLLAVIIIVALLIWHIITGPWRSASSALLLALAVLAILQLLGLW